MTWLPWPRILAVLALLACVWGAFALHQRAVDRLVHTAVQAALAEVEAATDAELAKLQRQAQQRETDAAVAALNLEVLQHDRQTKAAADAGRARSVRERLQHDLEARGAVRGGAGAKTEAAPGAGWADAAAAVAESLSECSGRYEQVAHVADQLAIQVIGLQAFITDVAKVGEGEP